MDGLGLWIAENVWLFLILGLAAAGGLAVVGGLATRKAVRRIRGGSASWLAAAWPIVLLVAGAAGVLYFAAGTVIMGPGLVAQHGLVGEPAPKIDFQRVEDGSGASLADHRGKVVLVNLWATWCPPCRVEMPELERLQQSYRDRGLVVVQLSDEPREVLAEFLEESPMSTEHGFVRELPLPDAGLPTTFVVDREGVVRRVILGPRSFEQFETEIERYL